MTNGDMLTAKAVKDEMSSCTDLTHMDMVHSFPRLHSSLLWGNAMAMRIFSGKIGARSKYLEAKCCSCKLL